MNDKKYIREKELIPHYDKHLNYYSPLHKSSYFKYMCDVLNVDISQINSVLDLGCGDGRLCDSIDTTIDYMGVDYSKNRIKKAKSVYKDRDFKVSCIHEFCDNQNSKYDLAVITEVLEHIENPYSIIKQLQAFNKNIKIIATVPINLPYVAHLSVWKTKDDVNKDINPDIVVVDKEYGGHHFMCGWGVA